VIPVSGGKDSTWQTVRLELGAPARGHLAHARAHAIGQRNLDNLAGLGVDHIDWRIDPRSSAFHGQASSVSGRPRSRLHMALFAIPLTVAARFAIPLVVWARHRPSSYGSASEAAEGSGLDGAWLRDHGVTFGTPPPTGSTPS